MKKLILILTLFVSMLFIACVENYVITFDFNETEVTRYETFKINPSVKGLENVEFVYNVTTGKANIEKGEVFPLETGKLSIEVTVKDNDTIKSAIINLNVVECDALEITGQNKVKEKRTIKLNTNYQNIEWSSSDESILKVTDGLVEGIKCGKALVKAKYYDLETELEIEVLPKDKIHIEMDSVGTLGEKVPLNITSNMESVITWTTSDDSIASIEGEYLVFKNIGKVILKATCEDVTDEIEIEVVHAVPTSIEVDSNNISINVGENYQIKANVLPKEASQEVIFTSSLERIATVSEDGVVNAICDGITHIYVSSKTNPDIKTIITVSSLGFINITMPTSGYIGEKIKLSAETIGVESLSWSTNDDSIASIEGDYLVLKSQGVVRVSTASLVATQGIDFTVNKDEELPTLKFKADAFKNNKIVINGEFDPLKGIEAMDNIDGDITDKITYTGSVNTKKYGKYTLTYSVKDSSGNEATKERVVEVYWPYNVEFIGHAGSFYGIMNSEEAILYAVRTLQYQAVEVDLKQTKDGVFVLCHDDSFAGKALADTNYSDLKDLTETKSRNAGYPSQNGSVVNSPYTTKICTLERYLEICREYNVKAVIELKYSNGINNNDQSRMAALMEVIRDKGMLDKTVFLASQYKCLIWARENGYKDLECQYLVNSCESESTLQMCEKYNFTVSINVTGSAKNSDVWLSRYQEKGIKISTYTFTQYVNYNVVQEWIDKGVDYVTCDWHIMSKLDLRTEEETPTHKVIFKDYDGKILKEAVVKDNRTAPSPLDPERPGYIFTGWDHSINNVKEYLEVTAQYELINYTITYVDNINVITKETFKDKSSFVNEFYTDLFNWFKENQSYIEGLKVSNNTFTLTRNGQTATFASVSDILAIDIYVFEKTISNVIYKPVVRNADDTCVIEYSEEYFLNIKKYLEKYKEMDQYFVNAIKNGYPNYNNTYKPTSVGKIQIMFRFHQWAKGTNIACFNKLPNKYIVTSSGIEVKLPTDHRTYTINDEFTLSAPESSYKFLGWYLDKECTGEKVEVIKKGSTGNITLYAKWEKTE